MARCNKKPNELNLYCVHCRKRLYRDMDECRLLTKENICTAVCSRCYYQNENNINQIRRCIESSLDKLDCLYKFNPFTGEQGDYGELVIPKCVLYDENGYNDLDMEARKQIEQIEQKRKNEEKEKQERVNEEREKFQMEVQAREKKEREKLTDKHNKETGCDGKIYYVQYQSCECHLCEYWNGCGKGGSGDLFMCDKCNKKISDDGKPFYE